MMQVAHRGSKHHDFSGGEIAFQYQLADKTGLAGHHF
jgi:hypothetical protein